MSRHLSLTSAESRGCDDPANTIRHELPAGQQLLQELLGSPLILADSWERLSDEVRTEITAESDRDRLLDRLVSASLLTTYQADRIRAGTTHGLVIGNYRVLDRLGAGAMGVVFKAEHLFLRRLVAIKVLPEFPGDDPRLVERFFAEMKAVALLQHPHIVAATDAGVCQGQSPDRPTLHYLVTEFVPGQDLEKFVPTTGLAVAQACDLIYQVASGLEEAHKQKLVHRDIKPSNILVTPDGQAKLLDFGLARAHCLPRLTEPGTLLGTMDYMAPEQATDASTVDIRADIYALGGTLFFCLTGKPPFHGPGKLSEAVTRRQTQPPPSLLAQRPDVPIELDATVARMLALHPAERPATPFIVMRTLLPFVRKVLSGGSAHGSAVIATAAPGPAQQSTDSDKSCRLLIVDDEEDIRGLCRMLLAARGLTCCEAENGIRALQVLAERPIDLVLLDVDMPQMTGLEVLGRLKENPPCPNLKVILMSGRITPDDMSKMLAAGASDYLSKPLSTVQLVARVKAALTLKEAQDRSAQLYQQLLTLNAELEKGLGARDSDLVHARNALVLTIAKLVGYRTQESGAHLTRVQRYSRILAEDAAALPHLTTQIDPNFIEMLECCAPLHDIGNIGLPDHVLLKSGKLDPEERIIMQSHAVIGSDTLKQVAQLHGSAVTFLQMACDIARHHHERYDGTGYPDRLTGESIPLAARILAIADVYDALRSRRPYRPGFSHTVAVQVMVETSPGQFDPHLLRAFERCAGSFERIFRDLPEGMDFLR